MEASHSPSSLRDRFIAGMSHAACTVNVVTTDGRAGRAGTTVSAMASVSADGEAPTLLVCLNHTSSAAPAILGNGALCVNVLREDQAYIAEAFAGRFRNELPDKFACTDWTTLDDGTPRVADALVAFGCRILSSDRVGTHHVLICAVEEIHVPRPGSPLIYANRTYSSSRRIDAPRSLRRGLSGGGVPLKVGCFQSFAPFPMPSLIRQIGGARVDLLEGDQRRLTESLISGETELALLFDLDLDDRFGRLQLAELEPYVLLPADHALTGKPEIRAGNLAAEPMILLDTQTSADYFIGLMRAQGCERLSVHRSPSLEMVRGLVAHGLGYALLTTKPAASVSYDGLPLVCLPLTGEHDLACLVLAWRRGHFLSDLAGRFRDLCASGLRRPEPSARRTEGRGLASERTDQSTKGTR